MKYETKTIEKSMKPNVCSLKKSTKLINCWTDQEKRHKLPTSGIKDLSLPNPSEIKRIMKEYFVELCQQIRPLLWNQQKPFTKIISVENLNRPITSK